MTENVETFRKEKRVYTPELNQIMMVGTIVKPPTITYSEQSGKACFKCRIVWNKRIPIGQGQWTEKVGYINCCMWNSYAEKAAERFKQKDVVLVQGSLDFMEIQNKENKIEIYNITIDNIQLISRLVEIQENSDN